MERKTKKQIREEELAQALASVEAMTTEQELIDCMTRCDRVADAYPKPSKSHLAKLEAMSDLAHRRLREMRGVTDAPVRKYGMSSLQELLVIPE